MRKTDVKIISLPNEAAYMRMAADGRLEPDAIYIVGGGIKEEDLEAALREKIEQSLKYAEPVHEDGIATAKAGRELKPSGFILRGSLETEERTNLIEAINEVARKDNAYDDTELRTTIAGKQDTIDDLEQIRSNASSAVKRYGLSFPVNDEVIIWKNGQLASSGKTINDLLNGGGLPEDALLIRRIAPETEEELLDFISNNPPGLYYCTNPINSTYYNPDQGYDFDEFVYGLIEASASEDGFISVACYLTGQNITYVMRDGARQEMYVNAIDGFGFREAEQYDTDIQIYIDDRINQKLAELDGSEVYY